MCDTDEKVCTLRETKLKAYFACGMFVLLGVSTIGAAAVFVKIPARPIVNITYHKPPPKKKPINRSAILPYGVGVAISDMTGPIAEIAFMGYGKKDQVGQGIHTRQWARAFVIDTNQTTFVLVSAEINIVGIALRREVVKNLQKIYGVNKYTLRNVFIGATGTFSGPGGYLGDFMLDAHIMGFSRQVFYAYSDGITASINKAIKRSKMARMYYGHTRVWNVNINRAPYAYVNNPMEERSRYDSDVDNSLRQIRIVSITGDVMGVMNWFPIHANSLNNTNYYVSSDNLGYASMKLEEYYNPLKKPGKGSVVAAFFVANAGDVSPNIYGARCSWTGADCDNWTLNCLAWEYCRPVGPSGDDMYDSAMMIGNGIYEAAMRILSIPDEYAYELGDYITIVHEFVQYEESKGPMFDPIERQFQWDTDEFRIIILFEGTVYTGCVAAIGTNYKYGTLDGLSYVDRYGDYYFGGNVLLDNIQDSIESDRYRDARCQGPKVPMLFTGRASYPMPYHQRSSLFVVNMGGIYLVGIGAEPTTMAGRRMRYITATKAGVDESQVIVMGNVNEYIHFIATRQEYYIQNYESAATLYGRRTLDIALYKLYNYLASDSNLELSQNYGFEPSYYKDQAISLVLPAIADRTLFNRSFGFVIEQPPSIVNTETIVQVKFLGANPRNDLKTGKTHFLIEGLINGKWTDIAYDSDWNTKLYWQRVSKADAGGIWGVSYVTVIWEVPYDAEWTFYRIRYYGAARNEFGILTQFEGVTDRFSISYVD